MEPLPSSRALRAAQILVLILLIGVAIGSHLVESQAMSRGGSSASELRP